MFYGQSPVLEKIAALNTFLKVTDLFIYLERDEKDLLVIYEYVLTSPAHRNLKT
jgi:hypothetical protein